MPTAIRVLLAGLAATSIMAADPGPATTLAEERVDSKYTSTARAKALSFKDHSSIPIGHAEGANEEKEARAIADKARGTEK